MSQAFHPRIGSYLLDLLVKSAAPAVLSFDADWRLAEITGDLELYGHGGDDPDSVVALVRDMFAGMACNTRHVFSSLELPNGSFAHIHLVPDPPFHHVLLIDASAEMTRERTVQQSGNEARLASYQTMRMSEARFRTVVSAMAEGVIVRDRDGNVTASNPAASRIFGLPDGVLASHRFGHFMWDALHEDGSPFANESHPALVTLRTGVPQVNVIMGVRNPDTDSTLTWLSVNTAPLKQAGNDMPYAVVTTFHDITERRQLEAQLRQSQKMEAIGQLTSGIAHDFNNLLGVVIGNLDLLERTVAGDESALNRVNTAQRAVMRGSDLTKRLLAFSRRQQLNPEALSVCETIKNVMQMATSALGLEIKISTHIEEGLGPILADSAGLENALLNLAINSRDAMPEGGTLTFAARETTLDASYRAVVAGEVKPGRYACITVCDTGKGMPAEVLERAFEPFFTTKSEGKGTGLGLAMVYGFVKQSGGHVNVYSEVGHGTTIRLYLPFASGTDAVAGMAPRTRTPAKKAGTVLVVDDEVDLLEVAVAYLDEMGFKVLWANDGVSALRVLERGPRVDLLLTDVVMPGGVSGVELARKARAYNAGLGVIYSTGFSSKALLQRTEMVVEGKVLSKPYRRDEFVAIVQEVVGNKGNTWPPDYLSE